MDREKDSGNEEVKSGAQRFLRNFLPQYFYSFSHHFYFFSILSSTVECKDELKLVKSAYLDETNEFDITVAEAIKILWKDPGSKLS